MLSGKKLREECPEPVGTRIELVDMPYDPYPIKSGTCGTVTGGNGSQVWVTWDDGRSLSLIPGVDRWRRVL